MKELKAKEEEDIEERGGLSSTVAKIIIKELSSVWKGKVPGEHPWGRLVCSVSGSAVVHDSGTSIMIKRLQLGGALWEIVSAIDTDWLVGIATISALFAAFLGLPFLLGWMVARGDPESSYLVLFRNSALITVFTWGLISYAFGLPIKVSQ